MKPIFRAAIYVFLILGIAAGAYFTATAKIDSLFSFRSPLQNAAPQATALETQPLTRRVVLILVDALRYDTSIDASVMPVLNELRAQGASARMHSQTPSYSEAGYSTLFTGGWPYLNDGPVMNLDYDDIPAWTQDNLFASAARDGKGAAVSGYYWFEKLIPQSAVSAGFYTPGEDATADRQVVNAALPWLDDAQTYPLVLVHIDQVDFAGHHEGGPLDARWNEAAARADGLIAEILGKLDLAQDTLMVFSDHGQVDYGGHGGHEAVVLVEPLVMAGAGVKPGTYGEIQMVDLAPTAAVLLGLDLPASAQGRVQVEMLALPEADRALVEQATTAQQEALVRAYAAAIGRPYSGDGETSHEGWQAALEAAREARLGAERWPRGAAAALVLAAGLFVMLKGTGKRLGLYAAAAGIYFLVYNLRYLVLDGLTYSFSAVASPGDLVLYNAATASAGFLASAVLLYLWLRREKPRTGGEGALEALRLGLAIIWLLGWMVGWDFTMNGLWVTWTTPEPASFYFGLVGFIQMLFVGIVSVITAGAVALASFLGKARARTIPQRVM